MTAEARRFAEWVSYRERKSSSALAPLLIGAYRARPLRPIIRRLAARLEGGAFFSQTLRHIFRTYYNVEIGRYSADANGLEPGVFPSGTKIGNYCSIGSEIHIFRRNHPFERVSQHPFFYNASLGLLPEDNIEAVRENPLTIGHDVHIGDRCMILPTCRVIGDGATLLAGSVVTKDVPAYTVISGNPGKPLRRRFADGEVERRIAESEWWLRPFSELTELFGLFGGRPSAQSVVQLRCEQDRHTDAPEPQSAEI